MKIKKWDLSLLVVWIGIASTRTPAVLAVDTVQVNRGSFSVPRSELNESRNSGTSRAFSSKPSSFIHDLGLDSLSLGVAFLGGGYQMASSTGLAQGGFSLFGFPRVTVLGGIETQAVIIDVGIEFEALKRSLAIEQLRFGTVGSTQLSYSVAALGGVNSRKMISTVFDTAQLGPWGFDLALLAGPKLSVQSRSSFDRGGLSLGWLARLSPGVSYRVGENEQGLFSEVTALKMSLPFEIGQMSLLNGKVSQIGYRLGVELAVALGE